MKSFTDEEARIGDFLAPIFCSIRTQDNDLGYLSTSCKAIANMLDEVGAEPEVVEPFHRLSAALFDLMNGIQTDLLRAQTNTRPGLRPSVALAKIVACVAISKAKKVDKRHICLKASRILGIPKKELWDFRKNLMRGSLGEIRSPWAHDLYDSYMTGKYVPTGRSGQIMPAEYAKLNSDPTSDDWLNALRPAKG